MPRPRRLAARAAGAALAALAALAPPPAAAADEAPAPTVERGRALLAKEDWSAAEAVFAAVVAADDTNPDAWFLLGYARHARGDFRTALTAHRRAAAFARVRPMALFNATCAHARLGETDEALGALGEAAAAGFRNRGILADDADLAELRKDPRLAGVMKPLLRGADAFVEPVRVLHEIRGQVPGEQFGWVTPAVGDLDGDGATDFAASAIGRGGGAGRVSAYSSRSGRLLFSADGTRGDALGASVATAGDVDGDGVPDVVAGATQAGSGAGYAVVLSGKTGATILRLAGDASGDEFGSAVCGVGDLDGDGRADVAVGASRADVAASVAVGEAAPAPARTDAGRVTVFSGRTGAVLVRIDGDAAGDRLGSALDSAALPAADGPRRLLAIGAMDAGPGQRGRVVVRRLTKDAAGGGFALDASPAGREFGQYFVAFAGDVDGDGTPDIYASDFQDSSGGTGSGRIVIASGRDGKTLLAVPGASAGDGFGTSRGVCGDVDGDGRPDLIVGAWQHAGAAPSGGRCVLVSGRDGTALATFTSRMDQDTLGFDAAALGDVDGDGATDFVLSAAWSEVAGVRTGRVWVVAGSVRPPK